MKAAKSLKIRNSHLFPSLPLLLKQIQVLLANALDCFTFLCRKNPAKIVLLPLNLGCGLRQ